MKRLPKDKVTLSIYVTPQCKEKLECLQQLYFIAGKRFSLSEIVEDSIHINYAAAYLSQEGGFWKRFFMLNKMINFGAKDKGFAETLKVVEEKKAATREILKVPLEIPKDFKSVVKKVYYTDLIRDLKKWLGIK
jgi:hypothetical protein